MARLTFESVKKYAEDSGYTLNKLSKGYDLQLPNGQCVTGKCNSLIQVIEKINDGWFCQGQYSDLPLVEPIEDQAEIKCIYPNCPNPCTYDCDDSDLLDKALFSPMATKPSIIITSSDTALVNEIGVVVIDKYQDEPEDITQYLRCETTKRRVMIQPQENQLLDRLTGQN